MSGLAWIRSFYLPCLAYSLTFISLFPVVVIKARGQDIFCSLPPRADIGSGDEGDNGAGCVYGHDGLRVVALLLVLYRYLPVVCLPGLVRVKLGEVARGPGGGFNHSV